MHERLIPYYQSARQESEALLAQQPVKKLEAIIAGLPEQAKSFKGQIADTDGVSIIAEHKRASPSEGDIKPDSIAGQRAEQYQQGGAAALSVLTNQEHFKGSLDDVFEARQATTLPILRKDFVSTETQLYQAKAYGADAVLLIVGGLTTRQLCDLQDEARDIELDCLVEVHNKEELHEALETCLPDLIGINNRDLTTLEVDLNTSEELVGEVPSDIPLVAESGYRVDNPGHLQRLNQLKVDGVLVGTDLMKKDDPAQAIAKWLEGYSISLK